MRRYGFIVKDVCSFVESNKLPKYCESNKGDRVEGKHRKVSLDRHVKIFEIIIARVTTVLKKYACQRTSPDITFVKAIEKRHNFCLTTLRHCLPFELTDKP